MTDLHFLLINNFLFRSEHTAKSEGRLGCRDILRISISIISGIKKDKKLNLVPLESPCNSEQDRPIPDYAPKAFSGKRGVFGCFDSEIAS